MLLRGGIQGAQASIALDNAFGNGVTSKTGNVMDAQLVHHLLTMLFNRLDADA